MNEDYVNEACPAQCNVEHDAPDHSEHWECEYAGKDRYGYTREFAWCDECNEWVESGSGTRIQGVYYCDPYEHNLERCSYCEEWGFTIDGEWDCWGDSFYCYSHTGRAHASCCAESEYDEYDLYPGAKHTPRCERRDEGCLGNVTHYHPEDESVMCEACAVGAGAERIPDLVAA